MSQWHNKLQGLMRDIVKKKRDEHLKMIGNINFSHKRLKETMQPKVKLRRHHEQLRTVIVRFLTPTFAQQVSQTRQLGIQQEEVKPEAIALEVADANVIEEVNLEYENVKEVDRLDITKEDSETWEAGMKRCSERIDMMETRITARLRDQLCIAKNAFEMFRIFSRLNALVVRHRIREYQTQLMHRVKDVIETLHEKFKAQYMQSKACMIFHGRDLPPISGLHTWVAMLYETVEQQLAERLETDIKAWASALEGVEATDQDRDMNTDAPATPALGPGGDPLIRRQVHDIRITNQFMYLHPSIEDCWYNILQQLFAWQAVVTSQNMIQSTRYHVGFDRPVTLIFKELPTKLPTGAGGLERSYFVIKKTITINMKNYVKEWHLQPDASSSKFGEDIASWMKLFNDLKKSRARFDTSENKKEFGPIMIDYTKVQSKVALKYDSWWCNDVVGKLEPLLETEMGTFHVAIGKVGGDLEQHTRIDSASTSYLFSLITYVQGLKRKMRGWEKQVEVYRECQRILEEQKFQSPSQWLHVDNIDGEWGAFNRFEVSFHFEVTSVVTLYKSGGEPGVEDYVVEGVSGYRGVFLRLANSRVADWGLGACDHLCPEQGR